MIQSIDELFDSQALPKVLLMFGAEDFLLEESLNKLIKYVNKTEYDSYNFDMLDADETNADTIANICSSFPMMSERRVVIVKRFDKLFTGRAKKTDKNSSIARYLSNPSPTTLLVLVADIDSLAGLASMYSGKQKDKAQKKIDSAKFPFDIILKNHEWIEFPKVYDSQYPGWVARRFKNLGKSISDKAVQLLVAQSAQSLREINNEIEKLVLFTEGKSSISEDDVLAVSGSGRTFNVFELQKSISAKDLNNALIILNNMLANDRQEMLIITMLTRYFTLLWKLIELKAKQLPIQQIASELGVNTFFIDEYMNASRLYSPADINNAFVALCDADLEMKSSYPDPLLSMHRMIIRIIEGNK